MTTSAQCWNLPTWNCWRCATSTRNSIGHWTKPTRQLSAAPLGSPGMLGYSGADLRRVAELQVDNAALFEGVNNTLKLLGDQYLARVYRLVNRRFHIDDWDASILRKLQTLESIYEKISDQASNRRMEILEWVIIILITFSIALEFI